MKDMTRREFVQAVVVGGVILEIGRLGILNPLQASASGKYDIGECKSVKVTCISETGWFDPAAHNEKIKYAGGKDTNQWRVSWDQNNAGGFCSLLDIESLDGTHHKILLDTGWNVKYMDECLKREGIDKMLQSGEIETLFISHEHFDHFMGLESVLRHNPKIKLIIPNTFLTEGLQFVKGSDFPSANARNAVPHTGELLQLDPGKVTPILKGCAAVGFDVDTNFKVKGEQSLYLNVKDKGLVCVTGCCHQGIEKVADFGQANIVGGELMYGVYGGLHITNFKSQMDNEAYFTIKNMAKYKFQKIACNHCTGKTAVEEMIKRGYPVVSGSGKNGSKTNIYIGNGDQVFFG